MSNLNVRSNPTVVNNVDDESKDNIKDSKNIDFYSSLIKDTEDIS
jgi:hypothetical protein